MVCKTTVGVVAHHLTIAQPKARGLKAGDQYAVPLCDKHHKELHGLGNERRWWAIQGVDPFEFTGTLN